ncbi:DUF4845 domain-containing protein [Psychrobacter sp. B38]|uniref:DUF4845 domain-containing protein n=1 Tax=Psychrobacter sp. B38 TaxID=3143538 RepID=UPI0032112A91
MTVKKTVTDQQKGTVMQQLFGLSTQRGASVTSIVLIIIVLGIAIKLMIAIVPAQIGDYQLTKTLSSQLRQANDNNETAKQFIERVNKQLSINADYDTKAEDVITFTDKKTGQLAIRKQYTVTKNFFGNVDILNRFEDNIDMAVTK